MSHIAMASDLTVAGLNNRVIEIMREKSTNAKSAIEWVLFERGTEGKCTMIDRTPPEGTSGGYVELYQLDGGCVNAWIVSQFADGANITDPDALKSLGVGFDNQMLGWGWGESDDRPDHIDADGREWY